MLVGIVLAAGTAERMGQPKQLLPWGAETVLGSALATATATLERVVVVLGAAADEIQARANLHGAMVVLHPEYQQGQASSLLVGLRAVATWPDVEAMLVLLGDQPTVKVEAIQRITDMYSLAKERYGALVPYYGERQGNPVLFTRAAWSVLQRELGGRRRGAGVAGARRTCTARPRGIASGLVAGRHRHLGRLRAPAHPTQCIKLHTFICTSSDIVPEMRVNSFICRLSKGGRDCVRR